MTHFHNRRSHLTLVATSAKVNSPSQTHASAKARITIADLIPEALSRSRPQPQPKICPETLRWLIAMVSVSAIYGVIILGWLLPGETASVPRPPPAAMVVELAPAPVAPPSSKNLPPGPEQTEATPSAIEPVTKPPQEPQPVVPDAPKDVDPALAVEKKTIEKPIEPPLEEIKPTIDTVKENTLANEAMATSSAPPEAKQEADIAAAPTVGTPNSDASQQRNLTWQNALMLKLNESKRYPAQARRQRQQGVVYLRFSMGRDGHVITAKIEQSSGHSLLDAETLALIERAQPLPIPPPEMAEAALEFVVPIEFFLRR